MLDSKLLEHLRHADGSFSQSTHSQSSSILLVQSLRAPSTTSFEADTQTGFNSITALAPQLSFETTQVIQWTVAGNYKRFCRYSVAHSACHASFVYETNRRELDGTEYKRAVRFVVPNSDIPRGIKVYDCSIPTLVQFPFERSTTHSTS